MSNVRLEDETKMAPLKDGLASVMHECESVATGAGCKRDLCHHLRSHQRPATQSSAVESSRCRVVRSGADGCDRCNDAGAGVSRNQLRYVGIAAGYDARLGLSLSRAFFRMGRGTAAEFLANSCAPTALRHARSGNSLRSAGERHDCLMLTPLVVAVIRRGKLPLLPFLIALATSANIGSAATLVGNPQNMIIGHFSHISFPEFSRSLLPAAVIGLAINFFILRFGFRKVLRQTAIDRSAHVVPKLELRFVRACLHCARVDLCRFPRWFESGVDGDGWCSARDGSGATRHAQCAEAGRLASALFFAALFIVVDGLSDAGLPDAIYSRSAADLWIKRPNANWNLTWFSVVGSNIFSNVPFVLVAGKWIGAICGSGLDVESACACDDVCRQSHDNRLGGEHDRGGIRARSYPSRFLGLRPCLGFRSPF